MRLNTDYSDIKRQIEELAVSLRNCTDKYEFHERYMTFCALKYIYSLKKRCRVELSKELDEFGIESDEEFSDMTKQSFLDNRSYHTEVLVNTFDKPSELLLSFIEENYKKYDRRGRVSRFRNGEVDELLRNFFRDNLPVGNDILKDIYESGHLYRFDAPTRMGTEAFLTFNSFDNTSNVFLYRKPNTVSTMAALVHEIGHAYDYFEGSSSLSTEERTKYSTNSIFVEVLSCYCNQLFLEYLLKNGIRVEETTFCLVDYFTSFFASLESALLLTQLSEKEYKAVFDGSISKRDVVGHLKNKGLIEEGIFSFGKDSIMLSGIDENRYSYGVLISNMILDGKIKLDDFMSLRGRDFSREGLENIGFSPIEAKKSLVKTMNETLTKKL